MDEKKMKCPLRWWKNGETVFKSQIEIKKSFVWLEFSLIKKNVIYNQTTYKISLL
jgi:hypothetical protein